MPKQANQNQKPPITNRGVVSASVENRSYERTKPKPENLETEKPTHEGMDWLTLSWPRCRNVREIRIQLAERYGTTMTAAQGAHGYSGFDLAVFGSMLFRENDIVVSLPGQALTQLRKKRTDAELCSEFIFQGDWKCTRIDFAMDCYDPKVSPQLCAYHWTTGHCTSRAEVARTYAPALPKGQRESDSGHTWYAGRPASTRFCRVYDKAEECRAKGIEPPDKHITRFELQHRHEAANAAFNKFAIQGPSVIKKLFAHWIQFREHDRTEMKKSTISPWWMKLVGTERLSLKLDPRTSTPQQTVAWLSSKQIAPSLALARRYKKMDAIEKAIYEANPSSKKNAEWKSVFGQDVDLHGPTAYAAVQGRGENRHDKVKRPLEK